MIAENAVVDKVGRFTEN